MTQRNHGTFVPASELQLGDIISLDFADIVYDVATVTQIEDGKVTLTRPYLQTSNFTCTSGVIPYLGWEEIIYSLSDARPLRRLRESDVVKHEVALQAEREKERALEAELKQLHEDNAKLRGLLRQDITRLAGTIDGSLRVIQDTARSIGALAEGALQEVSKHS